MIERCSNTSGHVLFNIRVGSCPKKNASGDLLSFPKLGLYSSGNEDD